MAVVEYQTNANGRRVGESHPKAKLSDEQVEQIRDMSERLGLSQRYIAESMGVPRRTVRCILSYENRAQTNVIQYRRPS